MTIGMIGLIRHCGVLAVGNAAGVITSTSTNQTESVSPRPPVVLGLGGLVPLVKTRLESSNDGIKSKN
jgi:hypothetical protein